MPLYDHFHNPVRRVSAWTSFHNTWLTNLAREVNPELPPNFYAEGTPRFGIEVDMAALERIEDAAAAGDRPGWRPSWQPPEATADVTFALLTDELEVLVYEDAAGGLQLVGAVEFVSPANKDRPESRAAFAHKCAGYLHRGIGLVMVDVVTEAHFNLHDELLGVLGVARHPLPGHLYATSYRPSGKNGAGRLAMWEYPLAVGQPLPTVPLCLLGGIQVPARLNESYEQTCQDIRLAERLAPPARPANGAA
jgi:hypothetical protein